MPSTSRWVLIFCLLPMIEGKAWGDDDPMERLPKGAILRLGSVNLQHQGPATHVAFSANGQRLLSAGRERIVRAWDAATGKQSADVTDLGGSGLALEGNALAVVQGNQVALVDAKSGKLGWKVSPTKAGLRCVALSKDGKHVAAGDGEDFIWLLSTEDGSVLRKIRAHAGWVTALAFTSDSKQIVSGGQDFKLGLWDVATGAKVHLLAEHGEWVWGVAASVDGKWIASASWDNTLGIWDRDSAKPRHRLTGHTGRVWCVTFSPDGATIASGGDDNTLRLWDAESGKLARTIVHPWWVNDVAFSPDGDTIATAGEDGIVRLWDAKTGTQLPRRGGHAGAIVGVAEWKNEIISAGKDGTVRAWDKTTAKDRRLGNLKVPLTALAAGEHGIAVGARNGKLFIVDANRKKTAGIQAHADAISGLGFVGSDFLVSSSWDGTISTWDTRAGKKKQSWKASEGWVTALACHPKGTTFASGGADHKVQVWKTFPKALKTTWQDHGNWVSCLAFSPAGNLLASGGLDEVAYIHDGDKLLHKLDPRQKNPNDTSQVDVYALAFSPDGKTLAAAGEDHIIRLWDVDKGAVRQTFNGHVGAIRALTYLADGTLVSGSDDGTALVWRIE